MSAETAASDSLDIRLSLQRDNFVLDVQQIIPASGVTAVFGRSGSGKTTLLRCIGGFEQGRGSISFRNRLWADSRQKINVSAHRRGVGYMFQEPRLFPHMNVAGNLEYARRRATRALRKSGCEEVVGYTEVIRAFELSELLDRQPSQLSGGEAQRVALARTLLTQPELLLLDEPLAALDDKHKAELLPYLETLVREFDVPMLYVSHDVEEVARLSSRMLVLSAGRVEAFGPTAEMFERLDIPDVSGRFDSGALLTGHVIDQDKTWLLTRLTVAGQSLSVPMRSALALGDEVRLSIRARDVALATQRPEGLSIRNALAGVVVALHSDERTPYAEITIELDPQEAGSSLTAGAPQDIASAPVRLRSRITRAAVHDLELKLGTPVFALVKSVTLA